MSIKLKETALYVHWPYCLSKCPYCDFNSHVLPGRVLETRFVNALRRELLFHHDQLGDREITSIFLGGGTPSLMASRTIARILSYIKKEFKVADDAEITLEVNPSSAEKRKFASYKSMGITRLSIGVQSFKDDGLEFLGRAHNVRTAIASIESAHQYFTNFSIDLIYARPGQTRDSWMQELATALSFDVPHMSLYELTIEPDTKFETLVRNGKMKVMNNDDAADLYEFTQEFMNTAGRPAYEVSNHALPGFESKHNLNYWRYGDYIGIGPGAHTRITDRMGFAKMALSNVKNPEAWYAAVDENGLGINSVDLLPPRLQADELVLNSARLAEGIDMQRYERLKEAPLNAEAIALLESQELVHKADTPSKADTPGADAAGAAPSAERKFLRPTAKGLLFSDYIARTLLNANGNDEPIDEPIELSDATLQKIQKLRERLQKAKIRKAKAAAKRKEKAAAKAAALAAAKAATATKVDAIG